MKNILLFAALVLGVFPGLAQVYFVDKDARGSNDGSTWQDAYPNLHDALDDLPPGSEIWVAEGVYVPYDGADRKKTFTPKSGMKLYGGFRGGETLLKQRDVERFKTILSGEAGPVDTAGNVCVLMDIRHQADTVLVDGFTFTAAVNYQLYRSTITLTNSKLKLYNCIITGNYSERSGAGGLYGDSCSVEINNCIFRDNYASSMRSIYLFRDVQLKVENSQFLNEQPQGYANYLVYFSSANDTVSFINCTFSGNNEATLYLHSKYSLVRNCVFSDNKMRSNLFYGGGILAIEDSRIEDNEAETLLYYSTLRMKNTQVLNNKGGLGYCFKDSTIISGCLIENNHPSRTNGSGFIYNMNADIRNTVFRNNNAGGFGRILYTGQTCRLVNCTFENKGANQAGAVYSQFLYVDGCVFKGFSDNYGGALNAWIITVKNSRFDNNKARQTGGAIYCYGSIDLENTIFTHNTLDTARATFPKQGGAIYVSNNLSAQNCVFAHNSGEAGAAVYSSYYKSDLFLRNCTFYNNFINTSTPGASIDAPGNMVVRNSILWDKGSVFTYPDSADVAFSILKKEFPGTGNIVADPGFDLNFSLLDGSPAIDAGTPEGLISWDLSAEDVLGNPRMVSSRIDIGATEYQTPIAYAIVTGNVYGESVNNCSFSEDDRSLAGLVLVAEPGRHYAATDSTGAFRFQLPPGLYSISPIQPEGKLIRNGCGDQSKVVDIVSVDDRVSGLEFYYYLLPEADMRVTVAQSLKRPCMVGTTKISYWNEGNVEAKGVQIKMSYPDELIPQVIPVANTRNKNLYTFFVGDIKPGVRGEFIIEDSVKCIVPELLGNLACVDASVSPYYTGDPGTDWDLSEVAMEGYCIDDTAFFELLNVGNGVMGQAREYRLFLNDTLIKEGEFLVPQGGSVRFKIPSAGKVVRMEADQVSGFPFLSKPSLVLPGCGAVSIADKLAYSASSDQDNDIPFRSTYCQLITGAYDPNDKTGMPLGKYVTHLVPTDQDIEFRINFQNTGNDTAFTVVIRDTLSALFDIASLKVLAASHSFTYSVSGKENPALEFRFPSIMLPDSNVNEAASHGYVIFNIKPVEGLASGTKIENRAFIYFDYNPPIETNTTLHTFGNDLEADFELGYDLFPDIVTGVYMEESLLTEGMFYPNPVSVNAHVYIHSTKSEGLKEVVLMDLAGRVVGVRTLDMGLSEFTAPSAPGLYIYEARYGDGEKRSGKILITE